MRLVHRHISSGRHTASRASSLLQIPHTVGVSLLAMTPVHSPHLQRQTHRFASKLAPTDPPHCGSEPARDDARAFATSPVADRFASELAPTDPARCGSEPARDEARASPHLQRQTHRFASKLAPTIPAHCGSEPARDDARAFATSPVADRFASELAPTDPAHCGSEPARDDARTFATPPAADTPLREQARSYRSPHTVGASLLAMTPVHSPPLQRQTHRFASKLAPTDPRILWERACSR